MIKGVSITLKAKTKTGTDDFNRPIYTTTDVTVADVLVCNPSADDINDAFTHYGKMVAYTLCIPKGDTNIWEDTEVVLPAPWAGTYHTIGYPIAYIPENIPSGIRWNKQIRLERVQNG
jgi:hypothetical protein